MRSRNLTHSRAWSVDELHSLLAPGEPTWAAELQDDHELLAALIDDDRDGQFLALVEQFLAS